MFKKMLSPDLWSENALSWASLILRLSLGGLMLVQHGYPKLMNIVDGNMGFADPFGIGTSASLVFTVFAEFICSILIILGLGTRLASIPLIATMLVVVLVIHLHDGMEKQEHGLVYLLPFIALLFMGSGKFSLDAILNRNK